MTGLQSIRRAPSGAASRRQAWCSVLKVAFGLAIGPERSYFGIHLRRSHVVSSGLFTASQGLPFRSCLVTSAELKVNRRTAESIRPRWRICAARLPTEVPRRDTVQQNFRAKMERKSCFTVLGAVGIVTDNMYQDPHSSSEDTAGSAKFSQKDREDAARLLALIVGGERARRIRSLQSTIEIARVILKDRKRRTRIF